MGQKLIKQRHFLLGFGFLACLVPLYWAKTKADNMRDNMRDLQAQVAAEKKAIHTLEAELSYLTRYDRIEKVSVETLGMGPIDGAQIVEIKDIDMVAPFPNQAPKIIKKMEQIATDAPK